MEHFTSWATWHWWSCTFLKLGLGLIFLDWLLLPCDTPGFIHFYAFNQTCPSFCVSFFFVYYFPAKLWQGCSRCCAWWTCSDTSGSGTSSQVFFTFAVISGDGTAGFCQGGASAHSPESWVLFHSFSLTVETCLALSWPPVVTGQQRLSPLAVDLSDQEEEQMKTL